MLVADVADEEAAGEVLLVEAAAAAAAPLAASCCWMLLPKLGTVGKEREAAEAAGTAVATAEPLDDVGDLSTAAGGLSTVEGTALARLRAWAGRGWVGKESGEEAEEEVVEVAAVAVVAPEDTSCCILPRRRFCSR